MPNDALFFLFGYGVKLSDLIALSALILSGYVGISSRLAAKRSEQREYQREQREREREIEATKVIVSIRHVADDDTLSNPHRTIVLDIYPADDGFADEIEYCEVIDPKSHTLEISSTRGRRKGPNRGAVSEVTQKPHGVQLELTQYYDFEEAVSGETRLKFTGYRHDRHHSPMEFEVTIPPGRKNFTPTSWEENENPYP